MNVLYFCNVNRSVPLETGVFKKILAQCKVLRSDGHNVMLLCPDVNNSYVLVNGNNKILRTINLLDSSFFNKEKVLQAFVYELIIQESIGCIYSRYGKYSISWAHLYMRLKKAGVKILLELPTYPLNQQWTSLWQSIKMRKIGFSVKQLYHITLGSLGIPLLRKGVSRIVNNNGFEKIWGIPVISIQNGIDLEQIPSRNHKYEIKDELTIMTVANVNPWHGFDRLIRGLYDYYLSEPLIRVNFEIVGPGAEVDFLNALAKDLNVDNYVRFHGVVVGKELDEIFERADIGVAILGIHRNNIEVIDCLKSREFCARKLPFITQDAEIHFKGKRFVLSVPSDESSIKINDIIDFYNMIVSDSSILHEMYQFAKEKCDWSFTFKNVRVFLAE